MKLTAAKLKTLGPGRHGDGGGLYFFVRPDGRRGWISRFRLGNRQLDMGLGSYPDVSLATARELASAARAQRRAGINPIEARKAERAARARAAEGASDRTFKALAERYIARHEATWKNDKHRAQWKSTLITYAYPHLGAQDVATIDRVAVLDVLEPIWTRAPETASRLRGRIETVLDYAAAKGWRTAANPARWRDLRHDLPAPKKVKPVTNQPALPWQQLPGFMTELRARDATAARALEFAILTAARTTEVLGAVWREVDLAEATWTIPARRMKAARPQRVALSPAAVAVLEHMKPLATKPDSFLFPGQRPGSRLSGMAMLMLLRRMQRTEEQPLQDEPPRPRWADAEGRAITPHGFRASFKTWTGDRTSFAREIVEAALAHTIKDRVEAAYQHSDLLDRRRPLMAAWADHAAGKEGAEIVEFSTARSA
jgi:integrase